MDIPAWKIICFIGLVFLIEYAIYGTDYYSEVFAEPPAKDLTQQYIIVRSEIPIQNSTYIRIRTPQGIDPKQYYGLTWNANQVETAIAYENIWSKGYIREATHPVYILTPQEVEALKKTIDINNLPTYGKRTASPFPDAAEWIENARTQITQALSLVWKILSFDIPNLPTIFRTIICFPIWAGLILSFFELIRGG